MQKDPEKDSVLAYVLADRDRSVRLPPYRIVGSNSESAGRVPDTADMAGKQLSTQHDQSSRRARHRAIHAEDG
jgi:hypothetical protein